MLKAAVGMAAAMAAMPAVASADRYVNQAAFSPTAKDKSCATAAYGSVQDAVNAAKPGEKVYLCGTTPYSEYVVIEKNLQLAGDPGATIQAPSGSEPPIDYFSSQGLFSPNAIVGVFGKVNVQINGLTVQGPFDSCGGQEGADFGVLILGGAHAQLMGDSVRNITESGSDCAFGVGVEAGAEYWDGETVDFTADVQIQNTSVSSYQEVGLFLDGTGTQSHVQSATVQGNGQGAPDAQVGVQIGDGATGEVANSAISADESSPSAGADGTGVEILGGCDGAPLSTNVQVHDNTLTNNDIGVAVSEFDPSSSCSPSTATPPPKPTNNQIHNNTIVKNDGETNHIPFTDQYGNSYSGYQAGINDAGNGDHIEHNTIAGTPGTGSDAAYGPQTSPGNPFLVPIDIQTEPTTKPHVVGNTLDGAPTSPPY